MNKNSPLEDQIKTMQTHFGRILSTVKHLKSSIDDLLEKHKSQNKEFPEMKRSDLVSLSLTRNQVRRLCQD